MFEVYSLVAGIAIGLSLAVPPGPMNALIAAESVKRSYVDGIKLGMGAMTADAIFFSDHAHRRYRTIYRRYRENDRFRGRRH